MSGKPKEQANEQQRVRLIGTWIVDDSDRRAISDLGDVRLEFRKDGMLIYAIRGWNKDQIIKLRYEIDGATIVTDQPSAPRVERTKFSLSDDGILTLEFNAIAYRFRRQAKQAGF